MCVALHDFLFTSVAIISSVRWSWIGTGSGLILESTSTVSGTGRVIGPLTPSSIYCNENHLFEQEALEFRVRKFLLLPLHQLGKLNSTFASL